jgi:hypothetical protein
LRRSGGEEEGVGGWQGGQCCCPCRRATGGEGGDEEGWTTSFRTRGGVEEGRSLVSVLSEISLCSSKSRREDQEEASASHPHWRATPETISGPAAPSLSLSKSRCNFPRRERRSKCPSLRYGDREHRNDDSVDDGAKRVAPPGPRNAMLTSNVETIFSTPLPHLTSVTLLPASFFRAPTTSSSNSLTLSTPICTAFKISSAGNGAPPCLLKTQISA